MLVFFFPGYRVMTLAAVHEPAAVFTNVVPSRT